MFNLSFWGKGAAFFPEFGNTNAWFERDGDLYCIDCGEDAFGKMAVNLRLETYKQIYVLLTHLHADHAGSLASLCSYAYYVLHKTITIVHPQDTVITLLKYQGIKPGEFVLTEKLPDDAGVSVEFKEVRHADDMKSYGLLLSDEDERIYYSGDAAYLLTDVAEQFLSGKIARIYHDTASRESAGHCYYRRLEEQIPVKMRKNVYCMHLDGDYVQMLKEHGFSVVEAQSQTVVRR